MSTNLHDIIMLAKSNCISEPDEIRGITEAMLRVPFKQLEPSTAYFKFVRKELSFNSLNTDIAEVITFGDVLSLIDRISLSSADKKFRLLYDQFAAFGLLEAVAIPQVRMFTNLSVSAFMKPLNPKDKKTVDSICKDYIKSEITDRTNIGDLIRDSKKIITRFWEIHTDIRQYEERIINTSLCLDLIFIETIKKSYPEYFSLSRLTELSSAYTKSIS